MRTAAVRHPTPAAFGERAGAWLLRDEPEHNLVLGIVELLQRVGPPPGLYLWTLERDGAVTGCALHTPPRKLILTHMDGDALRALADDAAGIPLPAVLGPAEVARAFARTWCERTGCSAREGMRQRLYRLDEVKAPPRPAPGHMRWATMDDARLAQDWMDAFVVDAMANQSDARVDAALRVHARELAFWMVDGEPRAMAGYSGRSPNGVRIGYVYTPRDWRGRGYASSLVAELSRVSLREGARFCCLYTDLDNPTSNSIYQDVGYYPVSDHLDIHFPAATT